MSYLQRIDIAQRIRGLIGGKEQDLAATAARLCVDEVSLRMSIDLDSPYPTVDVIVAVVREYGVDPTWLLTGAYNPSTHRSALDAPTEELPIAINAVIDAASTATPDGTPKASRIIC